MAQSSAATTQVDDTALLTSAHALASSLDCSSAPDDHDPLSTAVMQSQAPSQRLPASASNQTTTVIDLSPFRDVLAILLLLLQLPQPALTVVHIAFAAMTFVPPSTGWSLSSITSPHEWLHSSAGNPSLLTTIMSDITALLLWLVIPIAQDVTLDFALGVIAISLGGGVASKNGSTSSIIVCSGIIGLCHLFRRRGPRQHGVKVLWALLRRTPFARLVGSQGPPVLGDYTYTTRGWPRTLLDLHILAQGVVRIVRRHFNEPRSRPKDSDGASASAPVNPATANEAITEGARNTSTDGRPPGPPPTVRESKEKWSSGKKRRKQATHVRSQQPFWAAIANAKISLTKDTEPVRASIDSYEARATDPHHLGDARLNPLADHIWIQEVDGRAIHVVALLQRPEPLSRQDSALYDSDDDDDPINIRVNGAMWTSVDGSTTNAGDEALELPAWADKVWTAKIFGLTESTNYVIDFIRAADDKMIHSAHVLTPLATTEQSVPVPPLAAQSLRPSSPTTTLRNSIVGAETALSEHRSKAKGKKKDHKHHTTSLKRDVDNLAHRLAAAGGNDEKQRQRQLQIQQHIRQAEDALAEMDVQLQDLGPVPADEVTATAASKAKWQDQQQRLVAAQHDFEAAKADADRQIAAAKSDSAVATQKRDRVAGRLAKLTQQYDAAVATQSAKAKRDADRAAAVAEFQDREIWLTDQIQAAYQRLDQLTHENFALNQQAAVLHSTLNNSHHAAPLPPLSMSSIPETPDPGQQQQQQQQQQQHHHHYLPPPPPPLPSTSPFAPFAPHLTDHPRSRAGSMRGGVANGTGLPAQPQPATRERASSMLSNVSGLTDDVTAPASAPAHQPPLVQHQQLPGAFPLDPVDRQRQDSDGSAGSGSRRGSGSGPSSVHQQHQRRAGSRSGTASAGGSPLQRVSPVVGGLGRRGSPR